MAEKRQRLHDYEITKVAGHALCARATVRKYFVDPDGMDSEVCWLRDPSFAGAHAPVPFTGDLADLG